MFGGDARHTGRRGGPAPRTRPTEQWSAAVGGVVAGSPTIGPDGTIYVAAHDGGLTAVSPDGKPRWRFAMGDRSWSTPAVASDGTIYVGSDDDHLYAVTADGKLKWKLRLGACDPRGFGPESSRCDVDGGPTIGPDGTIYVGGDGIHAIWPDGTLRWKLATPEHVASTPALGSDGTVYAGCQDDALYAVAPDGKKRWEVRTGGDVDAAPAVGADGTIYVGSDDHALWSVSPDGAVNWKVVTGAEIRGGAAIGADGTVYVGSLDGAVYAIAPSGQVRWKVAAADKIVATPGIATNGTILGDGTDIYGKGYPDCVLVARKELIAKEPEVVKNVIRAFFEAEYEIENNFEEAAKLTIGKYYKTDMTSLLAAAKAQPPGIDIRDQRDFMFSRAQSMRELNYISKEPEKEVVNFTLL